MGKFNICSHCVRQICKLIVVGKNILKMYSKVLPQAS